VGEEEAAIFDAHLLCLSDPAIVEAARQRIFDYTLDAVSAWKVVVARTVRSYEALKDPYLKARAADVRDVGQRVLRLLTGVASTPLDFTQPAILVATDLTPSETAHLNPHKVLGICTIAGGATSHSGILARSLGIPAVVGVDVELLSLEDGTLIALDGDTGQVWVQPEDAELRDLQTKRDRQRYVQQEQRTAAQQPAVTQDGRPIQIVANIGGIADARVALENGAEGVGLLRSEFLYFDRESSPTEDEQVEQYEAIASILSPRPLIIRTLDIGGDKPLSYLNLASEPNPFLGWRGIRFLLDCPDVLKTQLRAILRATHHYPIKVMFPMIACLREIRAAKEILATAQAELYRAGIPFNESMEVGMMVEVPAAVAMAEKLAAEVDFFSIGTNDLSQYVMASDRTNPKVATLADAFEPAVLRMIQQTIQAARQAGIGVGVCGELASLPLATPILVGLGVDELSMNPPSIGAVKAAVGRLSIKEAQAIARDVLQLDSSEAVREYVAQKAGRLLI
jgi:phosphocarrier protein FPr